MQHGNMIFFFQFIFEWYVEIWLWCSASIIKVNLFSSKISNSLCLGYFLQQFFCWLAGGVELSRMRGFAELVETYVVERFIISLVWVWKRKAVFLCIFGGWIKTRLKLGMKMDGNDPVFRSDPFSLEAQKKEGGDDGSGFGYGIYPTRGIWICIN